MTNSPLPPPAKLPPKPSLALLGNLAKGLRKAHAAGDAAAITRLKTNLPRFASWREEKIAKTPLALRDAQTVIAREHSFDNWAALRQHVLAALDANVAQEALKSLTDAVNRSDASRVASILDAHPDIVDLHSDATPLHVAAQKGNLAIVELLLQRGADPTIRSVKENATALHFAARQGSLAIVKLLLDLGVDADGFGDVNDWDVIGWATLDRHTHTEVAQYLLAHGARHNIFSAVTMGDEEAIRHLMNRDVKDKPMAVWYRRRRPLHLAVIKKQPKVISVLLELGADVEGTDIYDCTALDVAAMRSQTESADFLLAGGATIRLPAAFCLRRHDVIDRLLRADPDALKPGGRWSRLLDLATEFAPADVIENLIAHGASVHALHDSKWSSVKASTPLHGAAWCGNLDAIRVLIKHGAALEVQDATYNATPAVWARHNGKTEALELLISLGAKRP